MKRITLEESEQWIPCEKDFTSKVNSRATYFTLEKDDEGWDIIKYFTDRKIGAYANYDGDYDSWIYILTNPSMPGLLKIGYTGLKYPELRANQLSKSTGVPEPYEVTWAFRCYNGLRLEQEVHSKLHAYRTNNRREHFRVDLDEAKEAIKELGVHYI